MVLLYIRTSSRHNIGKKNVYFFLSCLFNAINLNTSLKHLLPTYCATCFGEEEKKKTH